MSTASSEPPEIQAVQQLRNTEEPLASLELNIRVARIYLRRMELGRADVCLTMAIAIASSQATRTEPEEEPAGQGAER